MNTNQINSNVQTHTLTHTHPNTHAHTQTHPHPHTDKHTQAHTNTQTVTLPSPSFLFWLPVFLKSTTSLDSRAAALFSTLFDAGGIVGGVIAGVASDRVGAAETSVVMMWAALPALHALLGGFHGSEVHDLLPVVG